MGLQIPLPACGCHSLIGLAGTCGCVLAISAIYLTQTSAMNVSAQLMMKDAAKCDSHYELQNSVN